MEGARSDHSLHKMKWFFEFFQTIKLIQRINVKHEKENLLWQTKKLHLQKPQFQALTLSINSKVFCFEIQINKNISFSSAN